MTSSSKSSVFTDCEFLVRAIQGIVWEADPKTIRFTFVSEQAERILGYPAEVWLTDNFWLDHLHPEDRSAALKACARATAKGLNHEFEYRMIHADGRSVWFRDTVFVDMVDDEPVRLRGIMIDITEPMQMQSVIKESEQLLRLLATSVKDAIFRRRIQPFSHYEYISPAVFDITGYSPEEFYANGELGRAIVHPQDRGLQAARALVEPTGEPVTLRIVRKDGRSGWVELRSVTTYDDAGQPLAIEGIARDITDRIQLQEQLQQSQKMESLGQLVSGVAHDFNNMLTVILGYAGLALQAVPTGDPIRDNLRSIATAAERASLLTNQLLAFGRHRNVEPSALDVNTVVREMKDMLQRLIGEQIQLVVHPGYGLDPIMADAGQIAQVLLNLVVNARDSMPRGGKLIVQTSAHVSLTEMSLLNGKLRPGAYTVLSVTDSGNGIDPLARPHIFEPFFTTKPTGTGMGLATVLGVVNQSNGGITVESQMNVGTCFTIFFPVTSEPLPFSEPRVVPFRSRADETILIVEDDDSVRKVMGNALESAGYRVLSAKTGEEALQLFQSYSAMVHLAIIDMMLPDVDGRDLGERLASFERPTSVVYMSGYSDEILSRIEGFDKLTFIQKPFTPAFLLEKVRQLL